MGHRVSRYSVTGALFCLVPAGVLVALPATQAMGHALAWFALPPLVCGWVAIATGAAGAQEAASATLQES